jgi:hypothetical protein
MVAGVNYPIEWSTNMPITDQLCIKLLKNGESETTIAGSTSNDGIFQNLIGIEWLSTIGSSDNVRILLIEECGNPVSTELQIGFNYLSGKELQVRLYDSYGKLIMERSIVEFDQILTERINTSGLNEGVY